MCVWSELEVEMLDDRRQRGRDADSGLPANSRHEIGRHTLGDVEGTASECLGRVRSRCGEDDDDAVEVRRVRPPVPGIPAENELTSAVPALDEKRTAPDRLPGLRVVDAVGPDFAEICSSERVFRQNAAEQIAPDRRPRLEDDFERLRVDDVKTAYDRVLVTQ